MNVGVAVVVVGGGGCAREVRTSAGPTFSSKPRTSGSGKEDVVDGGGEDICGADKTMPSAAPCWSGFSNGVTSARDGEKSPSLSIRSAAVRFASSESVNVFAPSSALVGVAAAGAHAAGAGGTTSTSMKYGAALLTINAT